MTKLVILKLSGDFESGFQVSLEIGQKGYYFLMEAGLLRSLLLGGLGANYF